LQLVEPLLEAHDIGLEDVLAALLERHLQVVVAYYLSSSVFTVGCSVLQCVGVCCSVWHVVVAYDEGCRPNLGYCECCMQHVAYSESCIRIFASQEGDTRRNREDREGAREGGKEREGERGREKGRECMQEVGREREMVERARKRERERERKNKSKCQSEKVSAKEQERDSTQGTREKTACVHHRGTAGRQARGGEPNMIGGAM